MRFICIGAHPDDCESGFGGTAARLAGVGCPVRFLSVTNGRAGHHVHPPETVARIRCDEAAEAAQRLAIAETEVLDRPNGSLSGPPLHQPSCAGCRVPRTCPDAPALRRNPIFLYLEDSFRSPVAFAPDLVVDIDAVWERKLAALDAHASQFYEWLPWIWGREAPQSRALRERYPQREIAHAEAFQVCEYGPAPSPEELDVIFPR